MCVQYRVQCAVYCTVYDIIYHILMILYLNLWSDVSHKNGIASKHKCQCPMWQFLVIRHLHMLRKYRAKWLYVINLLFGRYVRSLPAHVKCAREEISGSIALDTEIIASCFHLHPKHQYKIFVLLFSPFLCSHLNAIRIPKITIIHWSA